MKRAVLRRTRPFTARIADVVADMALRPKLAMLRRSRFYRDLPRRRILVVGVQSPRRPGSLDRIFAVMARSRHEVVTEKKDIDGIGKLDNTNILIGRHDIDTFDWIWMTDDDVILPDNFTDDFVAMCEYAQLKVAGPAHRVWSYWSHPVTRRQQGALARVTNYVEVGPVAALHRDTFAEFLPLPSLKFGWGLDQAWPVIADRHGWKIGIVDAAPLQHTSPIGVGYDLAGAVAEAEAYMAPYGIKTGEHVLGTRTVITTIDDDATTAGRTDG